MRLCTWTSAVHFSCDRIVTVCKAAQGYYLIDPKGLALYTMLGMNPRQAKSQYTSNAGSMPYLLGYQHVYDVHKIELFCTPNGREVSVSC
jgi:hypothetical protein